MSKIMKFDAYFECEEWKLKKMKRSTKLFQTLTESNVFLDKNIIHKITMSEKRLPELMLNLAGLTDYVKLNDQYGIKVQKIEKSTFGALSRTFYITCTVSRPGHKFSREEVMVNGKKTFQAPIDGVRFEVKIV